MKVFSQPMNGKTNDEILADICKGEIKMFENENTSMRATPIPCEANTRATICDTAKQNGSLLAEANHMLASIETMLGGSAPTGGDGNKRSDPSCLLDEVVRQNEALNDMHCKIKRIYYLLNG